LVTSALEHRSPSSFFTAAPLGYTKADAEIVWYGAYLKYHSTPLTAWVRSLHYIQQAILTGRFDSAERQVRAVIKRHGWSLWACETLLAIAQYRGGRTERRQLLNQLKYPDSTLMTRFLLNVSSSRLEPSWSESTLMQAVEDTLSSIEGTAEANYIAAHVAVFANVTPSDLLTSLRFSATASFIDLYETYVKLCCVTAAHERAASSPRLARQASALAVLTRDSRLVGAVTFMTGNLTADLQPDHRSLTLNRALARGERTLPAEFDATLNNVDVIDLYARFIAITGDTRRPDASPAKTIIDNLVHLMIAADDTAATIARLNKLASDWQSMPFSTWILAAARRESADDPQASSTFTRMGALQANPIDPQRLADMPLRFRSAFGKSLTRLAGAGPWICNGYDTGLAAPDTAFELERLLYAASVDPALGTDPFGAASVLCQSVLPYYSNRGLRTLAWQLLRDGRHVEAGHVVAAAYFAKPQLRPYLPVLPVATVLAKDNAGAGRRDIAKPVMLDIASRHYDEHFETRRTVAVESFCHAWSVARPSELLVLKESFDHQLLTYFLQTVCTESVLEKTSLFAHSREVVQERLAIVQKLMETDPDTAARLLTEAKDLLRRITSRERKRQVEQNKVYLDLGNIRRAAVTRVEERFIRLRTELHGNAASSYIDPHVNGTGDDSISDIATLLRLIVEGIREEFVSNPDYGLDSYLSLRIRHGTLTNEMRAPFDVQKLITTRSSAGRYSENRYWMDRVGKRAAEEVNRALGHLSAAIDDCVRELKVQWLQVKRDASELGLFDFMISDELLRDIRRTVAQNTDVVGFVEDVSLRLSAMLERSLGVIRAELTGPTKDRVMEALDSLEAELVGVSVARIAELKVAIKNARTEAQRAIDRVAEWFRLSKIAPSEPFTLHTAITVAVEMLHFDQSVDVVCNDLPETPLRGDRFNLFVDLFIIVLQNIALHSRVERSRALIAAESNDSQLRLRVSNPVAPEVASHENRNLILEFREKLRNPAHRADVSREGGTGFLKLWKILTYDLRIEDPVLNFDVIEQEFVLEIGLPWEVCAHASVGR
jgi:hypothetical protein